MGRVGAGAAPCASDMLMRVSLNGRGLDWHRPLLQVELAHPVVLPNLPSC